jgi:hypothetical protein
MTDEEINEAIAPIQGWDMDPEEAHEWESRGRWVKSPRGAMKFRHAIPNYCNDLNAMHEAIMLLPSGVRENSFTSQLAMVCGFNAHGSDAWSELHQGRCAVINATARQRAEAFLRTLSKWEES